MKKLYILIVSLFICLPMIHADGGMWNPMNISTRLSAMKKAGLKLSAADIYNINKVCLKDKVLGISEYRDKFSFFATGTFVSSTGLILTAYQPLSKFIDEALQKDGKSAGTFVANSNDEEIYCKNLFASQLVQLVDVTNELLAGTENMASGERNNAINAHAKGLIDKYVKSKGQDGYISSFWVGRQYILAVYNIYKDIRLVNTSSKDYALLRAYVGADKQPARYDKANVALSGNVYAAVSKAKLQQNEYVMTMGFPVRTKWYIPSVTIDYMKQDELPTEIEILKNRIGYLSDAIQGNPSEAKRLNPVLSDLKSSYEENLGVLNGIDATHLIAEKRQQEEALTAWIKADAARSAKYGDVIANQEKLYAAMIPYKRAELLFNYALRRGSDVVSFIGKFEKLVQMFHSKNLKPAAVKQEVKRIRPFVDTFFATFNKDVQRQMFTYQLSRYLTKVDQQFIPVQMLDAVKKSGGDLNSYIAKAFDASIICSRDKVDSFLAGVDSVSIQSFVADPLYEISISYFLTYATRIADKLQKLQQEQSKYYRLYTEALLEKNGNDSLCPDANKTMRLSFGHVLQIAGDTFQTDSPVTNGSLGSPVFDARGNLLGIVIDRAGSSAIIDYVYSPSLCRTACLDIHKISQYLNN